MSMKAVPATGTGWDPALRRPEGLATPYRQRHESMQDSETQQKGGPDA